MRVRIVTLGCLIVCVAPSTIDVSADDGGGGGPFYQVWTPALPTDQSKDDIKPPGPVDEAHSSLVGDRTLGGKGHWVSDDELAGIGPPAKMARLALDNGADIIWVFKVCFGGGFFDELNAIPGGGHNMAINSASRYNEKCWYPTTVAADGVDCDWGDAYINAIGGGVTALTMATNAAANDPYGTNAGLPAAPPAAAVCGSRGVEKLAKEHPQYLAVGAGGGLTLNPGGGATRLAIFWSGDPKMQDDQQIGQAIATLLAPPIMWPADNIFILFLNGKVPGTGLIHPLIGPPTAVGPIPDGNLNSARECRLEQILANKYGPEKENPDLLFFMANDHGGSSDPRIKCGKGVAAVQEGDGGGQISEGDLDGPGDHDWQLPLAGVCLNGPDSGACCLSSGLCTMVPSTECVSLGGTYAGDGTICFDDSPISALVDSFDASCIDWNSRKLRTLEYASNTGSGAFTTTDVTPDGSSTVLDSHIGHFRDIDGALTGYRVTLDLSWTQGGNLDEMSAGLLLLDDEDELILSAGNFDDQAGAPPVSYILVNEPPAPALTTGPAFSLNDAATVRFTVEQVGANWTIATEVQTSGGATLLSSIETTPRQPAVVEMFMTRDHDEGVPFGSVSFEHFVMETPAPCPWDCGGDNDGLVGIVDFLALLGQWSQVGSSCDFNGGGVGITDFLELLANWGPCP